MVPCFDALGGNPAARCLLYMYVHCIIWNITKLVGYQIYARVYERRHTIIQHDLGPSHVDVCASKVEKLEDDIQNYFVVSQCCVICRE